jgi:hypothetical protein
MSKSTKQSQVFGPNPLDVRVRQRFIANGTLDSATLDKHLAALPDLAAQTDDLALRQPAMGDDLDDEGDE